MHLICQLQRNFASRGSLASIWRPLGSIDLRAVADLHRGRLHRAAGRKRRGHHSEMSGKRLPAFREGFQRYRRCQARQKRKLQRRLPAACGAGRRLFGRAEDDQSAFPRPGFPFSLDRLSGRASEFRFPFARSPLRPARDPDQISVPFALTLSFPFK